MTTLTLQPTDNQPTINLPDLITAISKVKGGYMIYNGAAWTYYPEAGLTPEQVEELEDWREELRPVKGRAA